MLSVARPHGDAGAGLDVETATADQRQRGELEMPIYECPKCGMSIGSMTCGKCGKELVHSTLKKDDGSTVHISSCPDGHGKVKSPMCCGEDMICSIG